MNNFTNSLVVLFMAFFFQKAEAEWYWWLALGFLFLLDEYQDWGKRKI